MKIKRISLAIFITGLVIALLVLATPSGAARQLTQSGGWINGFGYGYGYGYGYGGGPRRSFG
jgi:hypothetical protein